MRDMTLKVHRVVPSGLFSLVTLYLGHHRMGGRRLKMRPEGTCMKRESNSNLHGNEVYSTACSLLVALKNFYSKLQCQQGFNLIFFSFKDRRKSGWRKRLRCIPSGLFSLLSLYLGRPKTGRRRLRMRPRYPCIVEPRYPCKMEPKRTGRRTDGESGCDPSQGQECPSRPR